MVGQAYRQFKYSVRCWLGRYPALIPLLAAGSKWEGGTPRRETVACIEGFPRSANTFAVVAFWEAQPEGRTLHVARHSHLPGQVIRCLRQGLPTIVLIREPRDAIISTAIADMHLTLRQVARTYVDFYRTLLPYRDQFVTADFQEVTTEFGTTIHRLNQAFGTSFARFENTPEQVENCFAVIEEMDMEFMGNTKVSESHVSRPSEFRRKLKPELQQKLASDRFTGLLAEADALYAQFTGASVRETDRTPLAKPLS